MSEITALQRENEQLRATINGHKVLLDEKDGLLAELKDRLDAQQFEISLLLKKLVGKRSERYIEDPRQLKLDMGIDDEQIDDAVDGLQQAIEDAGRQKTPPTSGKPRKNQVRRELPAGLPRYEVIADVPDEDKSCPEHGERKLIGYDTTETLEYERPKLRVRVMKYPKYACQSSPACGVTRTERPAALIAGNRYASSVAAEIITAKYGYHLPVYRQQDLFAGCGWTPSRSSLVNILAAADDVIRPLIDFFADEIRRDSVIGTDDTGVVLVIPKTIPAVTPHDPASQRVHDVFREAVTAGKSSVNAKMWVYRGIHVPLNVFDFTVSRHRDGPDAFLIDNSYRGILLGDCYAGYTGISLRSSDAIVHAACVAHARRRVFEARHNHPQHASVLLSLFRQLYDIEDRAPGLDAAARGALRAEESSPLWTQMREYLDGPMSSLLPKEAMSQAAGYLNNQWTALTRHVSDGRIPIDNNVTEQLMKQVAIGRKNWLFIGSVAAGHRAANLMSLVSSALRNDLDVWAYVHGVLESLLSGATNYARLRPDAWAKLHPDQIREYRVEERRDRADRQHHRRSTRRSARAN